MVADSYKHRHLAKERDLVADEVIPGRVQILVHVNWLATMFRLMQVVLIGSSNGTQVTEMPIERCIVFLGALGYGGHDYLSANLLSNRDDENPRNISPLCLWW